MSQQKNARVEVDYEKLVGEMKRQGVFAKEPELNLATKAGIAVGGFCATLAAIGEATPGLGHAIRAGGDFRLGCSMGYDVKREQIRVAAEAKIAAAQAQKANVVAPAPA